MSRILKQSQVKDIVQKDLLKTNVQKTHLFCSGYGLCMHHIYMYSNFCLDLVNYLQKVSSDPALYASYFWWRQHYEVQPIGMGRHFVKVGSANGNGKTL